MVPAIVPREKFTNAFARRYAVYRTIKYCVPLTWLSLTLCMVPSFPPVIAFVVVVASFIYFWMSGFVAGRKMLSKLMEAGGLSVDVLTIRLESQEHLPWKLALVPAIGTSLVGVIFAHSLLWIGFSLVLLGACVGAVLFARHSLTKWVETAIGQPGP